MSLLLLICSYNSDKSLSYYGITIHQLGGLNPPLLVIQTGFDDTSFAVVQRSHHRNLWYRRRTAVTTSPGGCQRSPPRFWHPGTLDSPSSHENRNDHSKTCIQVEHTR